MAGKSYKIKTIQDIIDVITPENKNNFLKDFSTFLDFAIELKKMPGTVKTDGGFTWNDDGDYGTAKKVTITFINKS